jgi:hypothetical protein
MLCAETLFRLYMDLKCMLGKENHVADRSLYGEGTWDQAAVALSRR